MAELIAQGAEPDQRWRRSLPLGARIVLGRADTSWSAPWDEVISRQHVEICWDGRRLDVQQFSQAINPVFVQGRAERTFAIGPGEHFVIGSTSFFLSDEQVCVSLDVPRPLRQQTFSAEFLRNARFRRVGAHIDVLSRLPEVIASAANDEELRVRFVSLVLTGIAKASAATLVAGRNIDAAEPVIEVLQWDRRLATGDHFQPSQRLIVEALRRGESVLHVWNTGDASAGAFTAQQGIDWAFCTPVSGNACRGLAIYVAGRHGMLGTPRDETMDAADLQDDLKFTELAAATLGALRDASVLERERAALSQFFSPVVLDLLPGKDPEQVLAPREADVTVVFCDLRGFSRQSERSAGDLFGLLDRVSRALGVTTRHIREQGGVLGDFHGDAAMGFWGWPLIQTDAAARAALAALAIRRDFAAATPNGDDPLANFQLGIGIATGRAVAGKIGTVDQAKVTVFGPVVNLASRLEGMTKLAGAPILLDSVTATAVRGLVPSDMARLRRVAIVRPYGLETAVEVCELLPPAAEHGSLADEQITAYETALDQFIAGRFDEALRCLEQAALADPVARFLAEAVERQRVTALPTPWQGVIPLTAK
jgi:adenylate cyclase